MATHPVIDALDRCKIALQYLAEGQSANLTVVLELLVERLEDAIGPAHAPLCQCTCAGSAQPRAASDAAPRGVLWAPAMWPWIQWVRASRRHRRTSTRSAPSVRYSTSHAWILRSSTGIV
jgi:hypothetical protein